MNRAVPDQGRFEQVRTEWRAITRRAPVDLDRFTQVKREADALVNAGLWTSGPSDMLSILGRQRDELMHSRMIGWLVAPTKRHGLGRAVLTGFLNTLWPTEALMRSGPVFVDLEVPASGVDTEGRRFEARADIVLRGAGTTVIVENKVDAGEQPYQCERLYWAFVRNTADTRWVFLSPTGRFPVTATSEPARTAWRTMGYSELRRIVEAAILGAGATSTSGRATAMQYLETLTRSVVPTHE